jgi:hypothetical protein
MVAPQREWFDYNMTILILNQKQDLLGCIILLTYFGGKSYANFTLKVFLCHARADPVL